MIGLKFATVEGNVKKVTKVLDRSPAKKAGLKKGMTIISINGVLCAFVSTVARHKQTKVLSSL